MKFANTVTARLVATLTVVIIAASADAAEIEAEVTKVRRAAGKIVVCLRNGENYFPK